MILEWKKEETGGIVLLPDPVRSTVAWCLFLQHDFTVIGGTLSRVHAQKFVK